MLSYTDSSQKGNSGKWKTPKTSSDADGGAERRPKANTIEPGDVGIWVTCPLHMKGKAAREMELLFDDVSLLACVCTHTMKLPD